MQTMEQQQQQQQPPRPPQTKTPISPTNKSDKKNHLPAFTTFPQSCATFLQLRLFEQFSSCNRSSSELQRVFHRVTLHAQAGTVCTKTAASDLETTAYFLGQLRDYVHLKSSEEGSRGEVEPRSCLFFVPIGPT